jgi:large subunit ribosomal protein L5
MKPKSTTKETGKTKEKKISSTAIAPKDYMPRIKVIYQEKVIPAMMKEFGYKNSMQVPRVERIVLNVGMGEAVQNVKLLESAATELEQITGQKPVLTRAKKAIAGFKLREGIPIGTKVTLRGARMLEFLDRLVSVALPRIRDFRGVSPKAFDGRGNYTLGLKEQLTFPEIKYDDVASIHGMDITFVTTAKRNDEAKSLLAHLGMPFRKP